jgi:hypothetical protein
MMQKYTIRHPEDNETQELTVQEILDNVINNDRSDSFIDYDENDWVDGVLSMTEYNIIFKEGTKLQWTDPDLGICSGEVVLSDDHEVSMTYDTVLTDRGEMPLHELTLIGAY